MSALPGGLGDLVARAAGQPIYCTSSSLVRRQLAGPIVSSFQKWYPRAEFINAREIYRGQHEWLPRWSADCSSYGAAILLTFGEDCPGEIDPFAELAEEHAIGMFAGEEAGYFVAAGRPVAWYAVEFPNTYWFARFAIQPFELMSSARFARLVPDADAKIFAPVPAPLFGGECDSDGVDLMSIWLSGT
jgi:hypothetical protein